MSTFSRVEQMYAATEGMTTADANLWRSYVLGSLVTSTSDTDWELAIKIADQLTVRSQRPIGAGVWPGDQ